MRTRWWIIGTGALLALALAFVVMQPSLSLAAGNGPGHMGGRMGAPQQSLVAVAAQVLGIPQDALVAQLQSGKTIAQVAGDKTAAIVDAFVQPRAERLAEQVAAGRITQSQADVMLATMKSHVATQLTQPWNPAGTGPHGTGACDGSGAGRGMPAGRGMR